MKLKTIHFAALAAFTIAGSASAATTIFQDGFTTAGTDRGGSYTSSLGGTAPTVGSGTWTFDAETGGWGQTGSGYATPTSSNYLAFTPDTNLTYTVTATIDCSNWTNGEWFTVGFTQNPGNWGAGTGSFLGDTSEANLMRGGEGSTTISYTVSGATMIANSIGYVGWVTNVPGSANLDPANQEVKISNFSLTAVPEPSAALLGGLGMLALLRRRRA